MNMREEFEAWASKNYVVPAMENPIERATIGDGYHFGSVNAAWHGWKARHESLVIELPYDSDGLNPDHSFVKGWRCGVEDTKAAIEAAGLKVKP